MQTPIKHQINCRCILHTQKHLGKNASPFSFVVFSVINDDETVQEKYAQCPNCGVIHRVFDVCKSDIVNSEDNISVLSKEDIKLMIPTEMSNLLTSYDCDISTWEMISWIFANKVWGEKIILTRKLTKENTTVGKYLLINAQNEFKIEPFEIKEEI
jgi:hypothetical protein